MFFQTTRCFILTLIKFSQNHRKESTSQKILWKKNVDKSLIKNSLTQVSISRIREQRYHILELFLQHLCRQEIGSAAWAHEVAQFCQTPAFCCGVICLYFYYFVHNPPVITNYVRYKPVCNSLYSVVPA